MWRNDLDQKPLSLDRLEFDVLEEFKMMLPHCSTTGSSGLPVPGRKTARVAAPWHPVPFLEQKRCSEGFFVQKGLVGVYLQRQYCL